MDCLNKQLYTNKYPGRNKLFEKRGKGDMLAMWRDPRQVGTCPTRQGPLRRWKGHNAPRCTVCPSKKNSLQSSAARSVDVATLGLPVLQAEIQGQLHGFLSFKQTCEFGLPSGWARTRLCFWELEKDNQQVDNLGVCQCFKLFVVFFLLLLFFSGDLTQQVASVCWFPTRWPSACWPGNPGQPSRTESDLTGA